MQPIRNEILFKPDVPHETIKGIYVPDSCKEVRDRGTIIAVGRGTAKQPMTLTVGQIGHRVHLWGEPIIIDGETHYLMDVNAILAVE